MEKISSYHQFILEIEQILESQDQKDHTHIGPQPPKNY